MTRPRPTIPATHAPEVSEAVVVRNFASIGGPANEGGVRAMVRTLSLAPAIVLLVGLASRCSSSPDGVTTVPPAAGATDPGRPVPLSPGGLAVRFTPPNLLASRQLDGLTSMPWVLTAIDDPTSTVSLIYVTGDGDCVTPRGMYVSESATSVLVEVLSSTAVNRSACGSALTMARSRVTLDHPLGARTLIHAVVSSSWTDANLFGGLTA